MDKRNSMVVRLDMVMVVGPLPVTVMAVDSRKTRIFYSLAGRIMTQGNMIGNNQAQKINSVRSEMREVQELNVMYPYWMTIVPYFHT